MSTPQARASLFDVLETAVERGVFPGCVALVWRDGATLYHEAHGVMATHGSSSVVHRATARDTIYDLASLTKVLSTTTLVARLIASGQLTLEARVPAPFDAACPGATLEDLLAHCAGLVAHEPYFAKVAPFSREGVLRLVAATPPGQAPRVEAVYSDLGFIILGAWIEDCLGIPLATAFRDRVAYPLGLDEEEPAALDYRPLTTPPSGPGGLSSALERRIAPTEVYDESLYPAGACPNHLHVRRVAGTAHGQVHDDNAFVMGGVSGHAGLFGTAEGVLAVAKAWLEPTSLGFDVATRDRFWRRSSVPASSRCLGWDSASVVAGSPTVGQVLSDQAVGHTGFTGTSVWIDRGDPRGPTIYVLLSNRVHPTRLNDALREFRVEFHRCARAV